ncbi:DUF5658 family protein [Halobacteriales archaeon Cl-PHB]
MATADRFPARFARLGAFREALPSYVGFVYALVLVWGLGDVLSTFFALSVTGSVGMEANPWMRVLLTHEPLLVLALKAAVVLYAGVVLLECQPLIERVPGWQAWFAGVVGAGGLVVVNNTLVGLAALA